MTIKLHPRYHRVQQAKFEISNSFWELVDKHDISYLEAQGILIDLMSRVNMYALRIERHPNDPDRKADEE